MAMARSTGEPVRGRTASTSRQVWGTVRPGRFWESQRLPHHEEVGQHDERGVAVPALPAAALVVAQPKELLAVPEALLDGPAQAGQPHQLVRGHFRRAVGQVALEFVRGGVAAQQQPDIETGAETTMGHHAQDGAEHGLVAVMRKLLLHLNAVARRGTP